MGAHGAPHVLFLHGKTTKNIKNGLNGVEVAPFGVSLGRNGVPGGAEPLGLLPRPILGLFFFFRGFRPSGPGAPGPGALRCGVREAQFTLVEHLNTVQMQPCHREICGCYTGQQHKTYRHRRWLIGS